MSCVCTRWSQVMLHVTFIPYCTCIPACVCLICVDTFNDVNNNQRSAKVIRR
jgi:hypothetical protein